MSESENPLKDGQPSPEVAKLRNRIEELKGNLEFGVARKLLTGIRDWRLKDAKYVWITQQLALCTCMDEELLPEARFRDALELLEEIGLRDPDSAVAAGIKSETLPETLGLGGDICKGIWEYNGQLEYLQQALNFYRTAWNTGRKKDTETWNWGINAVYLLDVLTVHEIKIAAKTGIKPESCEEANYLKKEAENLRKDLKEKLGEFTAKIEGEPDSERKLSGEHRRIVVLAEIYFVLREYKKAAELLAQARQLRTEKRELRKAEELELPTALKRLVSIARLQKILFPKEDITEREWALKEFLDLDEKTKNAISVYRGKVGLALSGGGFRASLFHLGVLARLAEMDVLRSVEVLSTVSGGSIVGALYYLEVQRLLQEKNDRDITREDYVLIVRRIQERFYNGVRKNIRIRTLTNLFCNFKMVFSKIIPSGEYSLSHRIGELYDKIFYRGVVENEGRSGEVTMPQLLIAPKDNSLRADSRPKFKPKYHNWQRQAKVPALLLNATSLNSGHLWHFTGSYMGEPPASADEINVNDRYRRLPYEKARKDEHKKYRLGYAVAASACVPGLFEPLALEGLYPGSTIRLVDGGVDDNQGVEGLLDEGCKLILCSDACGQLEDEKRPSDTRLGVLSRTYFVSMASTRDAQYHDLCKRIESHALEGLFFIHLKMGLETLPIDWIGCDDPAISPQRSFCTTEYGVDKDLQKKLADIRTDLDSFSEVEAYSLMLSSYLMTEYEYKELDKQYKRDYARMAGLSETDGKDMHEELDETAGTWGDFDVHAPRGDWPFLELENLIRQPPDSSDTRRKELGNQLGAASGHFLIGRLGLGIDAIAVIAAIVLLIIGWGIYKFWENPVHLPSTVGGMILALVPLLVVIIFPILNWLRPQQTIRTGLAKIFFATIGGILLNLYFWIFNPLFLRYGKLKRLLELE